MVIQRWQSVLLLVAVVMMGCFSCFSLGSVQTPDVTFNFTALGFQPEGASTAATVVNAISTWYFFAVAVVAALLAFIAIFCFKQYRLQKNLCLYSLLLQACTVIVGALLGYQLIDGGTVVWSSWVCAPFIAIIATVMAYQRICADHRKIMDANRLR